MEPSSETKQSPSQAQSRFMTQRKGKLWSVFHWHCSWALLCLYEMKKIPEQLEKRKTAGSGTCQCPENKPTECLGPELPHWGDEEVVIG